MTIPKLRSELSGEGTDGTLTVSSCETHTTHHHSRYRRTTELKFSCTGTWSAERGGATYQDVTVATSSRLETGDKIPAVQVDNTFQQPQDRDPGKDAAFLALCLSLLAFGIHCLLTGFGARGGPGFATSWQRLPAPTVTGPLLGGLFALGLLAALVCSLAL
ncbi:hypothetical protein ACIHAA_16325 [Streptomyces sp. NPDC052040]|uniref:hypothetical protein n=1 Tax=Streptomyces sp. NPDC052040 TaxID=3365682 RepID=UPI0037D258FE